ncbi:MAG: endonuclease/exonuclease/phosphatase family protein [Candidatus Omnitrophica bacterium]|nr:endonuclease/exonuclease/phosphatase family protein [Candidatus Omnitrophota bacterium]
MFEEVKKTLKAIFSRSEWAIRLLRLTRLKQHAAEGGLVIIQIDGLSMTQFSRALQKGNLLFLQHLISRQRYVLRPFYSGLPSNTPGVQGELFYGIKGCVPAFHFYDRQTGRPVKMLDTAFVAKFEDRIKGRGEGLLEGGSAYCDMFTGGAKESHCCRSNIGWDGILWAANPLVLPFLLLLYSDVVVRIVFLVFVEIFIASFECARGILAGRMLLAEMQQIWQRSLVGVMLREFITAGVCMDIRRGLPVIHLNFLGYDEQAHGRGPSSAFAHWSLRGIDDAIRRIHHVMRESPWRHYDLWIYSDHGQAKTKPYIIRYGCTLEEAVEELFSQSRLPDAQKPSVTTTAMGPLGHIYLSKPVSSDDIHFYARKLVSQVKIPLVLTRQGVKPLAWTSRGCFVFPDETDKIFGSDHPFLKDIKEDLLRLCMHPDSGEFIIAGWCQGEDAMSFPVEYGAHAGAGPEETNAFVLLPMDAPVKTLDDRNYLRPLDLRQAVRHFLHKGIWGASPRALYEDVDSRTLTLMSYNVHGCAGMDGRISTERISRVITRYNPDIIALQELDVGRSRSGRADQAEMIARKLEMKYHFHPVFRWKDEQYGNAILSRYPMALIKSGPLPGLGSKKRQYEPRGVLWMAVEFKGRKIQVLNTHLSVWPRERGLQVEALLSREWLQHADCKGPVILCGDFNSLPRSVVYRKICYRLYDSQMVLAGHRPRSTWSGYYPIGRIDYIFVTADFQVNSILVPRTDLEKVSSDHLPLIAQIDFANS